MWPEWTAMTSVSLIVSKHRLAAVYPNCPSPRALRVAVTVIQSLSTVTRLEPSLTCLHRPTQVAYLDEHTDLDGLGGSVEVFLARCLFYTATTTSSITVPAAATALPHLSPAVARLRVYNF